MKVAIVLLVTFLAFAIADPVPITWEDAGPHKTSAAPATEEPKDQTTQADVTTAAPSASTTAAGTTAAGTTAAGTSAAAEATTASQDSTTDAAATTGDSRSTEAAVTTGNPSTAAASSTPASGTTPPPPPPSSAAPSTGAPTSPEPTTAAPTSAGPTTTEEPETTTAAGFVCPEPDGKFNDPEACEQYYECKDGVPTLKVCPKRQMFNGRKAYRECTRRVYFIDFDQCKVNDWTGFIPGRK